MIDLLVRAACDSGEVARYCVRGKAADTDPPEHVSDRHGIPPSSPLITASKTSIVEKSPQPEVELKLASLASSRHRSSFADRFFCDLVAGCVGPYYKKSCPHYVSVLRDERVAACRHGPGQNSASSWRPKHQLASESPLRLYCYRPPRPSKRVRQKRWS